MRGSPPLLCALALAACAAVGPDYAPPAVDHPDAWSTPLPGAGSASDPVHWWRAFQDPLLDQLVAQALARNQDLAIARQRLLQARAERDQAASRLGPEAGAGAEASLRARPRPCAIRRAWANPDYRLALDASWEIDVFGGRRRALEAADAQAQAEEEEGPALRVSLLAELASSTWRCARPRSGSGSRSTRWPRWKPRGGWRRRVSERGLGSAVEAAQARAELELGRPAAGAAREQARLAHAIGVLTGGFPGELKDALAQGPARMPEPPPLPSGLPSEMLRNRPDMPASERRLAAATARSAWPSRNAFRASSFRWTGQRGQSGQ